MEEKNDIVPAEETKPAKSKKKKRASDAITVTDLKIRYRTFKKMSIRRGVKDIAKKKTGYFEAVKGISFNVKRGGIVGIIGRNGSGKSTTLLAIAGIFSPDEGEIDLHGNTVSLLSIGVGFQKRLTGRENIYISGLLMGFTIDEIKKKEKEIIKFSELGSFIDRPVETYSSGMYSKLAFSITAVLETDIMLIDEVFSVGDASFKKKSYEKMRELINDSERTVVIVSHSIKAIRKLCNTVVWINDGEFVMHSRTKWVLKLYTQFMDNEITIQEAKDLLRQKRIAYKRRKREKKKKNKERMQNDTFGEA